MGLAIAWRLTRQGARVLILDPDPGSGATHAAAGMLGAVAEFHHTETHLSRVLATAVERYPEFIAELPARSGYERTDTLLVGVGAEDRRVLDELARAGSSGAYEALGPRRARAAEPLLAGGLACAYRLASDHRVNPRALATTLERGLRESRTATFLPATAVGVERVGGRVCGVRLDDGTVVDAPEVVLTCGAAIGTVEGVRFADLVRPVHGDVLRLGVPEVLQPLLSATIRARVHGRAVYLVPRGDGVVVGATQREDGRSETSAGGVRDLLNDAVEVVPAVAELELREITTRARPGTPDNAPLVGRVDDGLVLATGTFRNGILLAPLVADLCAALVTGTCPEQHQAANDAALRVMDPTRFDRETTGLVGSAETKETP